MKTFFEYCYYRISKAYKFFDDEGFYIYGSGVCALTLAFITLSIAVPLFYFLQYDFTASIAGCIYIPFFIFGVLYISAERYYRLEQKYKDEKYRKLKGWLVCFFVIGSLILYGVSLYLF